MAAHATNMTTTYATHMSAESAHMAAKPTTSHMATPAGKPATAATADRRNSAVNSGANNVLEVRGACYRLS
jgi:hypothetical protein